MKTFLLMAVGIFLCLPEAYAADWGDDRFSSDYGSSWLDSRAPTLNITSERWQLTISGGISQITDVKTEMETAPADIQFRLQGGTYLLNFPARSFATTEFDDGYSVQTTITRQISSWLSLGVQAGASFQHSHTVETGEIPFITYDWMGNVTSFDIIDYSIDYKAFTYHAAPVIVIGRYFPAGKFAWKPYVSGGAGFHQIQEKVVLRTAGTDFDLGKRTTSAAGALAAAGIDFRLSTSGSIGAQYQIQRIFASDHVWAFALPTLRFSYHF